MFGKWFKKKTVPSNDGNSEPLKLEKLQYSKNFEIELSNMEDSPVYALTHQLSIGSEIGNIIIADPSVSPRHASFMLKDEVVSVVDHGSVAGTFINGKKIDPGKSIILEESDIVMVGDLEIRLKVKSVASSATEIPDLPGEGKKEVPLKPEETKKGPKSQIAYTPKVKQKKQVVVLASSVKSTNALMRLLSVITDLFLSYAILTVFHPFDEFRLFLEMIPDLFINGLGIDWTVFSSILNEDFGFAKEMLSDAWEFLSSTFDILPLLLVFALNRLLSVFILGVSLSEFLLGIRPTGNALWARLGGLLRTLIGFLTGPFIIFDLPAIISRRTLKEVITFTNTHVPSKFIAILGIIFYFPLTVVLIGVAPLFQGLEIPESIVINDKIDQRIKVKNKPDQVNDLQVIQDKSVTLKMEIKYGPSDLLIIPNYRFQGQKNKVNLKNSLTFYLRDKQRYAEIEVFKTFDFKRLLSIGMKGNVFLYDRYPEIYNYVYEPAEVNIAFRKTLDPKAETRFANEFIEFTKAAFSLGPDNLLDFIQTDTPIIQGLVDYKSSFLSLIEYKDFDEIGFMKLGNAIFMKISFMKQKPFDLIVPLIRGGGRILKVTYDKKETVGSISSHLYKFNLDKTNWFIDSKSETGEVMTSLEVYDFFSGISFKDLLKSSAKAQSLYAYYFETSGTVLKKGDPIEIELWKSRLTSMLELLERLPEGVTPEGVTPEGEENPKQKLLQNFRDTLDAVENKNMEYFGIQETMSV